MVECLLETLGFSTRAAGKEEDQMLKGWLLGEGGQVRQGQSRRGDRGNVKSPPFLTSSVADVSDQVGERSHQDKEVTQGHLGLS